MLGARFWFVVFFHCGRGFHRKPRASDLGFLRVVEAPKLAMSHAPAFGHKRKKKKKKKSGEKKKKE